MAYFVIYDYRLLKISAPRPLVSNPLPFWMGIVFTYAMFIPNTWRRAAVVIGIICALPLVLIGIHVADRTGRSPRPTATNRASWSKCDHAGRHVLVQRVRHAHDQQPAHRGLRGHAAGPISALPADRLRRHGRGLSGRAPDDEAALRDQADPARQGGRSAGAGPLRARSAGHGQALALEHDRDLRLRPHRRRHVLLRDGVPAGPEPGASWSKSTARCRRRARFTCSTQTCDALAEAHATG